ncbi:MAG: hypothetical protein O3C25_04410 [Chloroflexi bacterium]|nr:hypothetical protein [Chloroflexota bacterium]
MFIKDFAIGMEVKTRGIEFEVKTPSGEFVGDLIVTSTQFIWCEGKTTREHGKSISLPAFRKFMTKDD